MTIRPSSAASDSTSRASPARSDADLDEAARGPRQSEEISPREFDVGDARRPSADPLTSDGMSKGSHPPNLWARAPRPVAVRLKRTLAVGAVLGSASILAASLAWAFVIRPEVRANALAASGEPLKDERLARPPPGLSQRPSRYDQLPQPRTLLSGPSDPAEASPPAEPSRVHYDPTSAPYQSAGRPARQTYRDYESGVIARPAEATLDVRARGSELFFADAEPRAPRRSAAPAAPDTSDPKGGFYNPARLTHPLSPYEIKAGTVIPAALLTAIDTSRRGPTTAVVTRSVLDTVSGRFLLVPQGSRLIGRYDGESVYGDRKAFVVWERLLLPDGRSLALDDEPGVDAAGSLGGDGRVNRRLLPLALAIIAGGAVTAIGEAARNNDRNQGLLGDAGDAAALEAARTGSRLIDRELQVRPVIRLSPGSPVGILITRDLVLEPWRP